jgi:hypothetical protein
VVIEAGMKFALTKVVRLNNETAVNLSVRVKTIIVSLFATVST